MEEIERIWDQCFLSTLHYGRKGLALNAISGLDLALWDLLGRLREQPVMSMLGGPVRDEISCYATGPRPDLAAKHGFVGGKVPLHHGPAEGEEGLRRNIEEFAAHRAGLDADFWLALDCWMSLDLGYATRLAAALEPHGLAWIEEPLLPDDYDGYAELRRRLPVGVRLATGEHEASRYGFQLLVDHGCADLLQPDIGWCGGLSELMRISAYADAHRIPVVPHGSSVYSYHYAATRPESPFTEFLVMHPDGTEVTPMFSPVLRDEPVPDKGRLPVSLLERPGFGADLNPDCRLHRPFPR